MFDGFFHKIESLTFEQIAACVLVVLAAGFSIGFAFGTGVEYSLKSKAHALQEVSDNYKLDLIYQMEVAGK